MLAKLYKTFWSNRFLNIFSISILALLLVGITVSFLSNHPNTVKAGDFPAFYAAGKLFLFNYKALYDLNAQALIQQMMFEEDGFHVFAYPPFVAPFYTCLSFLSPGAAKALYLVVLALSLFFSARLLLKFTKAPLSNWHLFALMFLFAPLTIGFLGGQNTPISLLFISAALYYAKNSKWLLTGVMIGLLNFKPQYSAIAAVVLFLLADDRIKFLIGFLATSLAQFILTLLLVGRDGITAWLILLKSLGEMNNNSSENVIKMTSIWSIYKNFSECCPIIALLLAIACALILLEVIRRNYRDPSIICPTVIFISPQTGFYDLALLLPFLLQRLSPSKSEYVWQFLGLSLLVYIGMTIQFSFKMQLLPIVSLIVLYSGSE